MAGSLRENEGATRDQILGRAPGGGVTDATEQGGLRASETGCPVRALLVLLNLLERHAEAVTELFLTDAQDHSA